MKHLYCILLTLALFLTASAQDVAEIEKSAKVMSSDFTEGLTLKSMTYNEPAKALFCIYDVDVNVIPFNKLKAQADIIHDSKAVELATSSDPEVAKARKLYIANGIKVVYTFTNGTDSFDVVIVPDDIQ